MTALGREGSSPSLRIGKELASASSLFFETGIVKNIQDSFLYVFCFLLKSATIYSQLKQEQDKRASKKVLQLGNTFLRCFLIWAHVFSIGLYSGE